MKGLEPGPAFDPNLSSESAYLDELEARFYVDLVNAGLVWKPNASRLTLRRIPEIDGRHATFWHMISAGSGTESERLLDPERCRRLHWVRQIIDGFNEDFPYEHSVRWWKSDRTRSPGDRYAIATTDYQYVVIVEQRQTYALLITAYYVEYDYRRRKFKREHDSFWTEQEPLAERTAPDSPSTHG